MLKNGFQRILSIYFIITFLMMILCCGIIAADCINRARTGEFELLPALNLAQFRSGGTREEINERLPQAVAYVQQLDESNDGGHRSLWTLINISAALSLCNIPFCFLLRLFDMKFPRPARIALLAGCAAALLLIFAARIYSQGYYGSSELKFRFPMAFLTWREIVQAAFILAAAMGIIRIHQFLKQNEKRKENYKNAEMIFFEHDSEAILRAENEAFALYAPIFESYRDKFKRYAVRLTAGIEREAASLYRAFIVCKIIGNDGKVVESADHDIYMDFAWPLSSCCNGQVTVFADVDDDAIKLLQACEEYFQNLY